MLSKINRSSVITCELDEFKKESGSGDVRYNVFYWDTNDSGNIRENCFTFYEGPPNDDKLQEAQFIASQLTK